MVLNIEVILIKNIVVHIFHLLKFKVKMYEFKSKVV